jgi:hypothetical protein
MASRIEFNSPALHIVANALVVSQSKHFGKGVVRLVVDASGLPGVRMLVEALRSSGDVDTEIFWGTFRRGPKRNRFLALRYRYPVEVDVPIEFKMPEDAILIDQIQAVGLVEIVFGGPHDTTPATLAAPFVTVEVSRPEFEADWDSIYIREVAEIVSRKTRLTRGAARKKAKELISKSRALGSFRMPYFD